MSPDTSVEPAPPLPIGDFSRITHLSVKTLRHYHEVGLLEPAGVDPRTGYRFYSAAQIPTAQVIRRFRDLGMPVREVGALLATEDLQRRNELIATHLERLQNQLAATAAAVASLRRLLAPGPAPLRVELRSSPASTVAAIGETVDRDAVLDWYAAATAELDAAVARAGLTPSGPRGGLYDDELFARERGYAVVYLPVVGPPSTGRVGPLEIPAAELAVTVHEGPHDDIDVTYGRLGCYVGEHGMAVTGPVREVYLVGPSDTGDAGAWRTEIGWPVFRTGKLAAQA